MTNVINLGATFSHNYSVAIIFVLVDYINLDCWLHCRFVPSAKRGNSCTSKHMPKAKIFVRFDTSFVLIFIGKLKKQRGVLRVSMTSHYTCPDEHAVLNKDGFLTC